MIHALLKVQCSTEGGFVEPKGTAPGRAQTCSGANTIGQEHEHTLHPFLAAPICYTASTPARRGGPLCTRTDVLREDLWSLFNPSPCGGNSD